MNILSELGIQQWRLREPLIKSSELDIESNDSLIAPAMDGLLEDVSQPALTNSSAALPFDELDWPGLESWVQQGNCDSCDQGGTIFGEGDRQADWMFLVDAPNADAVQQGLVVGGRARSLYQAILAALNLDIGQVYTTGVFKCAPSQDALLATACQEILARQVALVRPKVIVCLGEFSGQTLIKSNDSLSVLRTQECHCLQTKVPVIVSHGLTDLLQSPILKSQAWQDVKRARAALL